MGCLLSAHFWFAIVWLAHVSWCRFHFQGCADCWCADVSKPGIHWDCRENNFTHQILMAFTYRESNQCSKLQQHIMFKVYKCFAMCEFPIMWVIVIRYGRSLRFHSNGKHCKSNGHVLWSWSSNQETWPYRETHPNQETWPGAWWACFLPMVLGHMGGTCTHHLVASPPPLREPERCIWKHPWCVRDPRSLNAAHFAHTDGQGIQCSVCGTSFKYSNDKVNRSNREECGPDNKQKTNLLRKRVNLLFLILATMGRSCQPQGGGQRSQVSVTWERAWQ